MKHNNQKNANVVTCPPCGESTLKGGKGVVNKDTLMDNPPSALRATSPAGGEVNGGFTLIELLVVVLIIGILATIALPQYKVAVVKGRLAAIKPILKNLKNAHELYYLENGSYLGYIDNLNPLPTGTSCSTAEDPSVLKCDNYFLIDNINSIQDVVAAAYCPGFQNSWNGTNGCIVKADFTYTMYLDHSSTNHGKIVCTGKTPLGQAVCKAEGL